MPDGVTVHGPDGNEYAFPAGTTKDAAVAYFKKKGIGTPTKESAQEVPDANAQAKAATKETILKDYRSIDQYNLNHGMDPFPMTFGGSTTPETRRIEATVAGEKRKQALIGAGAGVGGAAVESVLPATQGGGVLSWLGKALARAGGTGGGAGAGALASGESPKEAAKTGLTVGGLELGGEAVVAGGAKVAQKVKPLVKFMRDVAKSKTTLQQEAHAAAEAESAAKFEREIADYKVKAEKVKTNYAENLRENSKERVAASVKQSAAEAKKGAALEHQNELARLLKENLEISSRKAAATIGKEFEKVSDAVAVKNPNVKINDATKTARAELYFPDSVQAFNNVMESLGGNIKSGDFRRLRMAYTKLNDVLYGGGEMPPDLYKAVKTVRDSLGADLKTAAGEAGLGGKYSKAMSDWSDYQTTFMDKSAIAKGGSPIRRILDAEDPAFVVDQLKGKAGDRLIDDIGRYEQHGADKASAQRLKGFINRVKGMPDSAGEIPEAPKRPDLPKAPERTAVPFDRNAAQYANMVSLVRKALLGGGGLVGLYGLEKMFGDKAKNTSPLP